MTPQQRVAPAQEDSRLTEVEQLLFRVARTLYAPRVASYVVDAPVDRAGLVLLARLAEESGLRLSDLASVLGLDLSTISRQARHLEDAGLVTRTADPDDRRVARLHATDYGLEVLARVRAARRALLARALGGWSGEDLDALAHLLERLADDLGPDLCSHAAASRGETR